VSGRAALSLCVALAASALACGPAARGSASVTADDDDGIAAIHAHKCGACHTPPEPRTRTREHVRDALGRHKNRVRLTSDEWSRMVEYLSAPEGVAKY
jgi:hypothetical protein